MNQVTNSPLPHMSRTQTHPSECQRYPKILLKIWEIHGNPWKSIHSLTTRRSEPSHLRAEVKLDEPRTGNALKLGQRGRLWRVVRRPILACAFWGVNRNVSDIRIYTKIIRIYIGILMNVNEYWWIVSTATVSTYHLCLTWSGIHFSAQETQNSQRFVPRICFVHVDVHLIS